MSEPKHTCSRCHEPAEHWISDEVDGTPWAGWWLCEGCFLALLQWLKWRRS